MDKIEKIKEWVKKQKKEELARNSVGVITGKALFVDANEPLSFLDTLQEQEVKEQTERDYWDIVLNRIDEKRILPTFKGKTLHDFKNELHTIKQIIGLINHPEIPEGLFDKLALVFAAWGGCHYNPKETECEDTLQEPEFPETFEICLYDGRTPNKENCNECSTTCSVRKEESDKSLEEAAEEFVKDFANRVFYETDANDEIDLSEQVKRTFKAGAEWKDRSLNWIRDLVKAAIKKPEEAQGILERIDKMLNKEEQK